MFATSFTPTVYLKVVFSYLHKDVVLYCRLSLTFSVCLFVYLFVRVSFLLWFLVSLLANYISLSLFFSCCLFFSWLGKAIAKEGMWTISARNLISAPTQNNYHCSVLLDSAFLTNRKKNNVKRP